MTSHYRIEVRAQEPYDDPDAATECERAALFLARCLLVEGVSTFTVELVEVIGRSERVLASWARASGGELVEPMKP